MSIQIMKIFKESFKDVWQHKIGWIRVAYAPLVVFVVGFLFMATLYWSVGYPLWSHEALTGKIQNHGDNWFIISFANSVYYITYIIAMGSLYINGFRYAILNEGGEKWWTLNLDRRFMKMVLYYFLVVLLLLMYAVIAMGLTVGVHFAVGSLALTVIIGLLFTLLGMYLSIRLFSLTFLLIAIDRNAPIRTGWYLLKGNLLGLVGLILLIGVSIMGITIGGGVLIGVFCWILSLISSWLLGVSLSLLFLFCFIMWLYSTAVFLKALSLVYKTFTEGDAF